MAERRDFTVVHEPFSQLADFGQAEVGERTVTSEADLIDALRELSEQTAVFFKDTTDFHYNGLLLDDEFLVEATHTFIVRHPAEAIASHFALNQRLNRDEIGFAWLAEIYDAVAARTGRNPVVIDSDDLVAHPEQTVQAYCEQVGIEFRPDALRWTSGLRTDWAKTSRWHESTSRTTGFAAIPTSYTETVRTNPVLAGYLDYHQPFYERLHANRLAVGSPVTIAD
jgi:hypothetical protein